MKRLLVLSALMCSSISASAIPAPKSAFQSATVASVKSHETSSNFAGSNPSDAPLQSDIYSYDIGIRLGCTIYRTHYDSAFDYLPSVFATNHGIEISPMRHVMYVSVPGERELRLGIEGSRGVKDASCSNRN